MSLTSSNVRVAVSGEVSVGATGAAAPATAVATLTGFTGLGYVSEDGITETIDRSIDDITAWQSATVVRSVVSEASISYQFTLIETTVKTIETALGVTVTQSASEGTYTIVAGSTGGRKSFVIDVIDGAALKRIYIAEGEVTELEDVTYASGEPIGLGVTVRAYTAPVVHDTTLKTP